MAVGGAFGKYFCGSDEACTDPLAAMLFLFQNEWHIDYFSAVCSRGKQTEFSTN
jgi:hypothetical protein